MNKKEKKQKEFIENLRKEVDELESAVNNIKKTNAKRAIIKNVRIFGKKARKWAPILAAGVIVSSGYVNYVGLPFFSHPIKAPAYIRTTQDSLGNIDILKQYSSFENSTSYVEITTPWIKDGEEYVRTTKGYVLDNDTLKLCLDAVNGDVIPNFNEMFQAPHAVSEQRSNHVDESELDGKSYIKVVFFTKDTDDYTVRMTSTDEVVGTSFMFVVALCVAEGLAGWIFKKDRKKCDDKIKKFKEDYKPLDEEVIRKELKLKRDNYNALMGE